MFIERTIQEIDYLEEYDGKLAAYEFKWNPAKTIRVPKTFIDAYPESTFTAVSPENYFDFLLPLKFRNGVGIK